MAGKTYIYDHILEYLEKSDAPRAAKELAEVLQIPYSTTARALVRLTRERRVRKISASGNAYLYKFVSHIPKGGTGKSFALATGEERTALPVDPKDLQSVVTSWINNGWHPKSIDAAKVLVETLSSIYELQWLEVTRGQPVDQSDLDHLKLRLLEAKRMADSFADFFGRLSATDALWDSKKTTAYSLTDIEDPQSFLESVRRVSEVLQ